jgi:hypothetical protein
VYLLLCVLQQVEAERVGRREDVVQEMDSSSQMLRLNQVLQQIHSLCAKHLQTGIRQTDRQETDGQTVIDVTHNSTERDFKHMCSVSVCNCAVVLTNRPEGS